MGIFTLVFLILLGLIFGSFGSVIFFRLGDLPSWKTLKSFFIGRSECRNCHHTLHTVDLLPLWSFFSQGGKCRYCKAKLSRWYPILEIWTVVIFVGVWWVMGNVDMLNWIGMVERIRTSLVPTLGIWLLFIIALYDLKTYELHLTASMLFLLLSFIGQWTFWYNLWEAVQGMLIFFGVFIVIYFAARWYVQLKYKEKTEGFGFGDVVMAGILGTVFPVFISVGVLEWVYLLSTYLIVSCILGIIVYGILYWTSPKRITPHTAPTIPFLPSMIIAFIFFVVEGNTLISFLVHM